MEGDEEKAKGSVSVQEEKEIEEKLIQRFGLRDWSEELCISVLGAIAIVSILLLDKESIPVVTGIGGGLVGYLTRGIKQKTI